MVVPNTPAIRRQLLSLYRHSQEARLLFPDPQAGILWPIPSAHLNTHYAIKDEDSDEVNRKGVP
jgi:hypothetical protein